MAKYCFVIPRCGEGIAGGAEALAGSLAKQLLRRGDKVEILTTCARDNRTWKNELPEGPCIEDGILVRRFSVDERNLDIWIPLQIRLSEGLRLTLEEQIAWMENSVNSVGLYDYILKRGKEFDALFFAPYLFGTTFWGSLIYPERSVLIPCLHDESYAYTEVIGAMVTTVGKAIFNAEPEQSLAMRLFGKVRGGVVGMGFDLYQDEEVNSLAPYFKDRFPYIIYVGRKETGKNVPLLIDYFTRMKDAVPETAGLKLVIAGGGSFSDLHRNNAIDREDIVDIGHCTELDKQRLIRHSLVLCQPSTNESFSIVLMEAWRLSVPVLVHARCEVTRHHVISSGGGLFFGSQGDFIGVVLELMRNQSFGRILGKAGLNYVGEYYSWASVLGRFDRAMQEFIDFRPEQTVSL